MTNISYSDFDEKIIQISSKSDDINTIIKTIIYLINLSEKELDMLMLDDIDDGFIKELSDEESIDSLSDELLVYANELLEKTLDYKCEMFMRNVKELSRLKKKKFVKIKNENRFRRRDNTVIKRKEIARILVESTLKISIVSKLGEVKVRNLYIYITYTDFTKKKINYVKDILNKNGTNTKYSLEIIKKIGRLIPIMSYPKLAKLLNDDGIDITRQSIYNIVKNNITPKILEYEKQTTFNYMMGTNEGEPKKVVSTLFVEWDGLFIAIKGSDRRSSRRGLKKNELKLGKAYIGWTKRYGKGDNASYATKDALYVSGFETSEVLREMLNSKISEVFNYAKVDQIIVGGDGASWVFNDYDIDNRVICQLDMYHIISNINTNIKDKKLRSEIKKLVSKNKFVDIIDLLEKKMDETFSLKTKSDLRVTYTYFINNFSKLRRYKNVIFVELEQGLEARNLGTMETSIRRVLKDRMGGSAWSLEGARAMSTMLCLYHEGNLEKVLDIVFSDEFKIEHQDKNIEELVQEIKQAEYKQIRKDLKMARKKRDGSKSKYLKETKVADEVIKEMKRSEKFRRFTSKDLF